MKIQETPTQNRGNRICTLLTLCPASLPARAARIRVRIGMGIACCRWELGCSEGKVPANRIGTDEVETMGD